MMRRSMRGWVQMACVAALITASNAAAQEAPAMGVGKKLPPGILTTIPIDPLQSETFTQPRPLVELLADPALPTWTPNYSAKNNTLREMASKVIFRSTVFNLEFSFKPLRMLEVDIPQPTGKMQRKNLWYMVYKVRNNGYHLSYKPEEDAWKHKTFGVEKVNQNIYFFPEFVFRAYVHKPGANANDAASYQQKEYLDRLVPVAMKPIAERERVGVTLHDSVSISKVAIPVSDAKNDRSVWGVMIWEDIDPHVNFASIFVQGLTNAYKAEDPPGAYKAGDPIGTGRIITTKTLQLNFWRPGDAVNAHEEEIRYGVPLDTNPTRQAELFEIYGVTSPLDYLWVYR
ncbi:MAG TPA: hypothetical protein VL096_12830 [Pirellulaceae bacterium]|nr:hypothetical protein [Pirellulaceae bacterium]